MGTGESPKYQALHNVKLNRLSATDTLSLIIQIWKCSETVNDFESEMACNRQSNAVNGLLLDRIKTIKSDAALLFLIASIFIIERNKIM